MITQNKGEWSELYVFLKLLGDGILYAADADLNKKNDLYYPLIEILRKENEQIKHYTKDDLNINIIDDSGNNILSLPASEFEEKAALLLKAIKNSGSTFPVPAIEDFMQVIKCSKVKADSMDKSDITLVLHDCKTYRNETFGFSIKSRLGGASTLFNAGKSTNFTYEIFGDLSDNQIENINNIHTHSKIKDRMQAIQDLGCVIKFSNIEHAVCKSNLQMVDSKFPLILSEYILLYYSGVGKNICELTPKIMSINPCNFNLSTGQLYYEHKMKNFLTDTALGMTAASVWSGNFQATGGFIIVREDGEVLCYHIYNHNDFKDYLFKNTYFDTPDAKRHDFGYIYRKNNKNYIKLNAQIRFR